MNQIFCPPADNHSLNELFQDLQKSLKVSRYEKFSRIAHQLLYSFKSFWFQFGLSKGVNSKKGIGFLSLVFFIVLSSFAMLTSGEFTGSSFILLLTSFTFFSETIRVNLLLFTKP